jgi:hypothetical protein
MRNDSGRDCSVYWVHPQSGDRTLLFQFSEGSENHISSFLDHSFEIEENGSCTEDASCLVAMFTVKEAPEQAYILDIGFHVLEVAQLQTTPKKTESPNDCIVRCRDLAKRKLQLVDSSRKQSEDQITKDLTDCVKKGLALALQQANAEMAFVQSVSQSVASGMENFTCSDPNLDTSPDVDTRVWTSEKDGTTRTVHVKLDRPTSRIHVIEEFAYKEECDAIQTAAKNLLHQASTVDGKGGAKISENRRAMQAAIDPKWPLESGGDLISRISRRVYDYVNYELGLSLEEHGQEPIMSIQYFGRGYNDTTPDRYTPHCDGPCDGDPFVSGSRMATMVIYCDIPSVGGHTNFQNADVHVKPEARSAVFFSYIDPTTNITDSL